MRSRVVSFKVKSEWIKDHLREIPGGDKRQINCIYKARENLWQGGTKRCMEDTTTTGCTRTGEGRSKIL